MRKRIFGNELQIPTFYCCFLGFPSVVVTVFFHTVDLFHFIISDMGKGFLITAVLFTGASITHKYLICIHIFNLKSLSSEKFRFSTET